MSSAYLASATHTRQALLVPVRPQPEPFFAGEGALSNPYFEDYPQAEKYATSGYQPVKTFSELVVETNQFRTGLVLSSE